MVSLDLFKSGADPGGGSRELQSYFEKTKMPEMHCKCLILQSVFSNFQSRVARSLTPIGTAD